MHTSGKLLRQVRRALGAVFVLGGFASLLQLALPIYALHVFESAIPTASHETLALLTVVAAGAGVTLVCLAAARERILLRTGLWLDHTLGQHMLANGSRLGTPPAEVKKDADALARFSAALGECAVTPVLDAPWLVPMLGALALLSPTMAAVAAASTLLLGLAALTQASRLAHLAQQDAGARENAATWWLAETLGAADARLRASAAGQWEQLNRAHIAAAYARGQRSVLLQDAVRLLQAGTLIALIAVGAWLVMAQQLTLPSLFACLLINALLLARLERLVQSLPVAYGAMAAYRRLAALPADAQRGRRAHDPEAARAAVPAQRLNLMGPLALGAAAVLLFIVAGLGAAYARLGDLAGLAGGAVFETRLAALQYPGGAGTRLYVTQGANVHAGDLIITRDTAELDRQIAMLKALAEAARSQLGLINRETSALVGLAEPAPVDRPKLASLEQRIGELEKEGQELLARIASAEQELARSQVRAPVSGRVVALSMSGADASAAPGTIRLDIATADRPLLYRLLDPMLRTIHSTPGARAVADTRNQP